ncbi:GMC oxidoreductase-domain-containing protein [Cladochytrium replicatum]|nr:GMC oxidoreductase-domain-containing protein [Cladochytrium replicatum]
MSAPLHRRLPSWILKWLAVPAVTAALYTMYIARRETLRRAKMITYASAFEKEYDYIVIGAGSAGCAVAARLSENPNVTVLLIESGPNSLSDIRVNIPALFPATQKSEVDWNYTTSKQPATRNRASYWPRGRLLGGSSSTNAMLWVRGSKDDFGVWETDYGCEGWNWDVLLPIFKRIENMQIPKSELDEEYHGFDGPVKVSRTTGNQPCVWNYLWVRSCEALGVGYGPRGEVDPSKGFTNGTGPGRDYNGASIYNAACMMSSVADGVRQHTGRAYVAPIIDPWQKSYRSNFTLLTDTTVAAIESILDPRSGLRRAVGVKCIPNDGKGKPTSGPKVIRARKEVILSGGAIGSPQILKLSGIGPRNELKSLGIEVVKDLPGVGENLQDHLFFSISNPDLAKQTYRTTRGAIIMGLFKYFTRRTGMLMTAGVEATAFMSTPSYLQSYRSKNNSATPPPNIQFFTLPIAIKGDQLEHIGASQIEITPLDQVSLDDLDLSKGFTPTKALSTDFDAASQAKLNANDPQQYIFTTLVTLVKPLSRGRVSLTSASPYDHPIIDPHYLEHPADVAYMVEGAEVARKIHANMSILAASNPIVKPFGPEVLNKSVIAELRRVAYIRFNKDFPDEVLASTRAYTEETVRRSAVTVYHPVGTCKMGPQSDEMSVVSHKDLKVYGFENLRVADASVMPEITAGNTNAPSIVIGERCADFIKSPWAMK